MWARLSLAALILINAACARSTPDPRAQAVTTPTRIIAPFDYPKFKDDYSLKGMKLAIDRQLKRFKEKPMSGTITLGSNTYPLTKMKDTLVTFSGLIDDFQRCTGRDTEENCYADLNREIARTFDVYVPNLVPGDPRYGEAEWALFTGYHTMPIEGSTVQTADYPHAVYGNPNNPSLNFTRVEIDFLGKLAGRGLELFYAKSLFDIYLLHVQGSGKASILNPDGTKSGWYLNYDGTNSKKWEWISKYMLAKGYITNSSIAAQKKFLRQHPELQQEIYATCPSYVYERLTKDPPMGSDSVPVTDARSIAQDSGLYSFKGLLSFIETTRPEENGNYDLENEDFGNVQYRSFSRFVIDQDTGGAIKGKARADIYFGEDLYAMFSAANMKQPGKIYYMILK